MPDSLSAVLYNVSVALLLIIGSAFLLISLIAAISGAPWLPTRQRHIAQMLKDAGLKPGEVFIELGSGDGRVLVEAAKDGAKVTGYEINPALYLYSLARILVSRSSAKVRLANFWQKDLFGADVVMTFLVPRTMPRLAKKLEEELKPGARLISYSFNLPGKKPALQKKAWQVYKF